MPLLVAPGTILPLGSCKERPDYDYTENLELLLTEFEDGAKSEIFVPDVNGARVMKITAARTGKQITVTVEGGKNWTCRLPWAENVQIQKSENQVLILLP
jgi:alpha-D-xyloside xylohydrolase